MSSLSRRVTRAREEPEVKVVREEPEESEVREAGRRDGVAREARRTKAVREVRPTRPVREVVSWAKEEAAWAREELLRPAATPEPTRVERARETTAVVRVEQRAMLLTAERAPVAVAEPSLSLGDPVRSCSRLGSRSSWPSGAATRIASAPMDRVRQRCSR